MPNGRIAPLGQDSLQADDGDDQHHVEGEDRNHDGEGARPAAGMHLDGDHGLKAGKNHRIFELQGRRLDYQGATPDFLEGGKARMECRSGRRVYLRRFAAAGWCQMAGGCHMAGKCTWIGCGL